MFSELLPNITSSVLVFFTLIIANNIVLEAALSFLGAGVQDPTPSWGKLIADGQQLIVTRPALALAPGHRDRPHRAVAEHLRRRPARRARSAREGEGGALMLTFLVTAAHRRDPRLHRRDVHRLRDLHRRARRRPGAAHRRQERDAAELIVNIRHTWGFDQPFYVPVLGDDEEDVQRRPRLATRASRTSSRRSCRACRRRSR